MSNPVIEWYKLLKDSNSYHLFLILGILFYFIRNSSNFNIIMITGNQKSWLFYLELFPLLLYKDSLFQTEDLPKRNKNKAQKLHFINFIFLWRILYMHTVFLLFPPHSPHLVLLLCFSTLHQIYDLFSFDWIYANTFIQINVYTYTHKYIYIHMHIYSTTFWVHLIILKFCSLWGNWCRGNISSQQPLSGEVMKPRGQRANACFVSKHNSQLHLCTYPYAHI